LLLPIPIHDPHQAPGGTLKRLPLRKAAVLFIVAVGLCLSGLLYLQLEQSRRQDLTVAKVASSNLTRAMAQQAEDTFLAADLVMTSLVDWIQEDGYGAAQKPRLQRTFARRVQQLDQLHGMFLFDTQGQWVITSFADLPRGNGVADREYFKFHQQNVSTLAHIGPAIRSRENGEWIIPISKRINDHAGNFQGVLLAGIKMSYFDRFFESFSLDDQGIMFLGLSDGTLLARRPFDEKLIGTSLAHGRIYQKLLPEAAAGTAMIHSVVDGVVRLYGYRRLSAYPLVVSAATSRDTILKGLVRACVPGERDCRAGDSRCRPVWLGVHSSSARRRTHRKELAQGPARTGADCDSRQPDRVGQSPLVSNDRWRSNSLAARGRSAR
jgi:hypothetical protein